MSLPIQGGSHLDGCVLPKRFRPRWIKWLALQQPDTNTDGYEVKRLTGAPRFCRMCKSYKPPRAHHCRTCNRYGRHVVTKCFGFLMLYLFRCVLRMGKQTWNSVAKSPKMLFQTIIARGSITVSVTSTTGILYDSFSSWTLPALTTLPWSPKG